MKFKQAFKMIGMIIFILVSVLPFEKTAFCSGLEYDFDPEEIMYLSGIKTAASREGIRWSLYDIDKDGISELFTLDEADHPGLLEIFRYDHPTNAAQMIFSLEDVTEVYGDPLENSLLVAAGNTLKKFVICNSAPEEKANSSAELKDDQKPLSWVSSDQWTDGSIIGVASSIADPGPQNDFYLSSNYEWLASGHISAAGEIFSEIDALDEVVIENKEKMFADRETYRGADIQIVRDYYDAAVNWEKRNADGVEPVKKYLEAADSVSSLSELTDYLTDPALNPFSFLLSLTITLDEKDTSHWAVEIAEDHFSVLPRIYHNRSREEIEEVRTDFDIKARHVLLHTGFSKEYVERIMAECYELEEILLPLAWPNDSDEESPLNGFQPFETVTAFCSNFPLEKLLNAYQISGGMVHVYYPGYLEQLDRIYTEENLPMLKSYLIAHTAAAASVYLDLEAVSCLQGDGETEEEFLEFLNRSYQSEALSPRELVGVAAENAYMTYFADPETRSDLITLAEEIRSTFRERLSTEDWLSDAGKAAAIEKLDNMSFSVMAPDELIDSSYLAVDPDDSFLDTVAKLTVSRMKHNGAFAGKLREKGDWRYDLRPEIASSYTNAFYYGCFNQFFILSGIVSDSIYRPDMPKEEKLAYLGEIIGHELTHGFDPNGIRYDKNGNMVQSEDTPYGWMPEVDHLAFMARAQKIADYFDVIYPFPYASCPGETQWGEAAADIGGLTIGLDIAAGIDGFDYDRYFRAYSNLWRKQSTLAWERSDINDAHPLSHLRINVTLQQFDEFLHTYGVREGDGMYLAPEDRISIW